jgi:hypothetical protein
MNRSAEAASQSAEDRARDALAVALESGPTSVTRATLATYCRTVAQDASKQDAAASTLNHSKVLSAATTALSDDEDATAALHRLLGTGGQRPGLLAQRVPLGSLLGDGIPPTPFLDSPALGDRLFYAEAVWIVSGHKKSGKSWALAATALDCAKAGRPVVYVDFENGHRMFAKRMLLLGADAETVDEHLHYVELPLGLSIDGLHDDLDEIADALPGAFVVIDSLRGFMARLSPAGRPLDPNAHQDIESVCAPLTYGAKRRGLTWAVSGCSRQLAA